MTYAVIVRRNWRRFLGAGSLIVVFLFVWAFVWEPSRLTVREQTLALPQWPVACAGLRVAVLSDLHVGSPYQGVDQLDRIVARTNALKPDLVLLAGDYVVDGVIGGTWVAPEVIAEHLRPLSAKGPVFAVLGNHDWWLDPVRVRNALEAAGIPVLEDASMPVVIGQCRFHLVGISDATEGAHDIPRAFSAVPQGAAILALTHNPDVFPDVPARGSLVVAGHTHGGQVALPFVGRPIVPSRFGQRFAVGHIVEGGRHLFVSQGLGTSILPVRWRVPPELSLLSLRPMTEPAEPAKASQ